MEMFWVLISLFVLLFLLFLVLFTKIKVFIHYYHGQDNDDLKIKFKGLFGLVQYKINIPVIKIDDNSPSVIVKEKVETGANETDKKKETKQFSADDLVNYLHNMKELLAHVIGLQKILRNFLSKVSVKNIEWHSRVGVRDAAYTGMITGALWTVKGSLLGLISSYMKVSMIPQITVTPVFNAAISQTMLKCMIQFRIGHAILAGIKIIRFWKGGIPHFRKKPLSGLSKDKTKSV